MAKSTVLPQFPISLPEAMSSPKTDAARHHRKVELMIQNESRKIRKPKQKPVIVYMVSPKVIHVQASEFMALVQRLTGPASASSVVDPKSSRSNQSITSKENTGSHRQFPVKVKARALKPDGSESGRTTGSYTSAQSLTPFLHGLIPVSCDGGQEGSSMNSQSWFLEGDNYMS